MARIKIKDLTEDVAITEDDMRRLKGGPARRTEAFGTVVQFDPIIQYKNVLDLSGPPVNPYLKWD